MMVAVLSSCQMAGKNGDTLDTSMVHNHILLAPPFIIDAYGIDLLVERLGETIDAVTGV